MVDILKEELIAPELQSGTKTEVLRELALHMSAHHPGIQAEHLLRARPVNALSRMWAGE